MSKTTDMQNRLMGSLDQSAKRDLFKREIPSPQEAMAAVLLTDLDREDKKESAENMESGERIVSVKLSDIIDHPKQPYRVEDNEEMEELAQSIKDSGILSPILLTATYGDTNLHGKYMCVAGHRRRYAAHKAGLTEVPAIIRSLSEEDADIMLVSTNSQREDTLPSEKAKAFKIRYEALKRKEDRRLANLGATPSDQKFSADILAEESGVGVTTVKRFLRLNELMPEWLDAVDNYARGEKKDSAYPAIGLTTGVALSYLKKYEQQYVWQCCDAHHISLSLELAEKMKGLAGNLSLDIVDSLFFAEKNKNKKEKDTTKLIFFSKSLMKKTDSFFPEDEEYQSPEIREATIIEALTMYWESKGIVFGKR